MVPVGTKVIFHSQYGDTVGWVVEHKSGRDAGDHFISGFHNHEAQGKKQGQGHTFAEWSVVGDEQGAFTPVS
jgi:hypothetical protein